jgi:NADH-ubiquinone oxidoreductase chain 6
MNNIIVVLEAITNGFSVQSIESTKLAAIFFAIFVIISKNPIVSVLCLIALFLSVSCYLMLLGLNFIGLSYLLVYVGAVSILFLFILMLINVRTSELLSDTTNSIPLAITVAISFIYALYHILPYNIDTFNIINDVKYFINYLFYSNTEFLVAQAQDILAFVTSKIWDGALAETTHITSIGNIIYTSYSMWIILTSIILLLAMVGAIVITIKQKN